jgi:hypothetical protein
MRRVGGTHRTVTAALTAAVLLLAACSSDGTSRDTSLATSTTGATPESTAPSVTEASTAPTPPPTPSTAPLAASMVTFTTAAIGLDRPVDLTFREGDPALYIVQQGGTIVPLLNGTIGSPVLDISDLVSRGGEQGLLGMAFHSTKPLAYVDYTDVDGNTVIAEYSLEPNGQFDTASERTVLTVRQPYPNHNGGKLLFGNDGLLYIGLGDGGAANDPQRRGQNLSELLGKILRIDPTPDGTKAYTIPADNPFVGVGGARGEIWAYGLRNPWRFDFDRATGDLWIADVGQNEIEEIDVGWATEGGGRAAGVRVHARRRRVLHLWWHRLPRNGDPVARWLVRVQRLLQWQGASDPHGTGPDRGRTRRLRRTGKYQRCGIRPRWRCLPARPWRLARRSPCTYLTHLTERRGASSFVEPWVHGRR